MKDGTAPSFGGALQRALTRLLEAAAGLMLVAIVLIVFAGVVSRYFLHIGLGWTEEAARFLLIWMMFVGATAAVSRWSHFRLALLTNWIPRRLHRPVDVFAIGVVVAMSLILVRYGIDITRVSWAQTSPMLDWPMGWIYLVVPASGALMLLFGLAHLAGALRGRDLPGASPPGGETEPVPPSRGGE